MFLECNQVRSCSIGTAPANSIFLPYKMRGDPWWILGAEDERRSILIREDGSFVLYKIEPDASGHGLAILNVRLQLDPAGVAAEVSGQPGEARLLGDVVSVYVEEPDRFVGGGGWCPVEGGGRLDEYYRSDDAVFFNSWRLVCGEGRSEKVLMTRGRNGTKLVCLNTTAA